MLLINAFPLFLVCGACILQTVLEDYLEHSVILYVIVLVVSVVKMDNVVLDVLMDGQATIVRRVNTLCFIYQYHKALTACMTDQHSTNKYPGLHHLAIIYYNKNLRSNTSHIWFPSFTVTILFMAHVKLIFGLYSYNFHRTFTFPKETLFIIQQIYVLYIFYCNKANNSKPVMKINVVKQCEAILVTQLHPYVTECDDGYFGSGCSLQCNCADGSEVCRKSDGKCDTGCPHGYAGQSCQISMFYSGITF